MILPEDAISRASVVQILAAAGQGSPADSLGVTTVNHLAYTTPKYVETRDFYVDLIGARVAWDDGTKCQVDFGPWAPCYCGARDCFTPGQHCSFGGCTF